MFSEISKTIFRYTNQTTPKTLVSQIEHPIWGCNELRSKILFSNLRSIKIGPKYCVHPMIQRTKLTKLMLNCWYNDAYANGREFQCSNTLLKNLQRNEAIGFEKGGTPLHLGRKSRLREVEDITSAIQDGQNLLRWGGHHKVWGVSRLLMRLLLSVIGSYTDAAISCLLVFRFKAASNANKAPCMSKESSSSHDHNSKGLNREPCSKFHIIQIFNPHCFDGNARDIDM